MVGAKFFAVAALAVGAFASPVESVAEGKQFKVKLDWSTPFKKTLYLTEGKDATPDASKAMLCKLSGDKIACGSKGYGLTYGSAHTSVVLTPTASAANNKNWKIDPSGNIKWTQGPSTAVHFSLKSQSSNQVYAEICSSNGHPDGRSFKPASSVTAVYV